MVLWVTRAASIASRLQQGGVGRQLAFDFLGSSEVWPVIETTSLVSLKDFNGSQPRSSASGGQVVQGRFGWWDEKAFKSGRSVSQVSAPFAEAIDSCNHWRQIQKHIGKLGITLDPSQIELVFTRLKKLEDRPIDSFLDTLLTSLIYQIKTARPRHVANVLDACVRLSYSNKMLLEELLNKCIETKLYQRFLPENVSVLCFSLGMFYSKGKRHLNMENLTAKILIHKMSGRIANFVDTGRLDELEVARIVYGLGLMKIQHKRIHSALGRLAQDKRRLEASTRHGLAAMLYGYSQIGFKQKDRLMHVMGIIQRPVNLMRFSEIALSCILYSAIELGYNDPIFIENVMEEIVKPHRLGRYEEKTISSIVYSLGKLGFKRHDLLDKLCDSVLDSRRVVEMSNITLSCVTFGLGRLGYKNDRFWRCMANEVSKPARLRSFLDEQLGCLAYSFGVVHYPNADFWDALSGEVIRSIRLERMSERDLSSIMYGVGRVKFRDEDRIGPLVMEVQKPKRLGAFTDQGLAIVLGALGQVMYTKLGTVKNILKEFTQPHRLNGATGHGLALTIFSLGNINYKSKGSEEVRLLVNEAGKPSRVVGLEPRPVACMLYGLGKLNYKDPEIITRLVFRMAEVGLEKYSTHELCNVLYGLGAMSFPNEQVSMLIAREVIKNGRIGNITNHNLTTLVLGLGYLGVLEGGIQDTVLDASLSHLDSFSFKEISKILHGVCRGGNPDMGFVRTIVENACKDEKLHEADDKSLLLMMYSMGAMRFDNFSIWEKLCDFAGDPERMWGYTQEGLSNWLYAMSRVRYSDDKLAWSIVRVFMEEWRFRKSKQMDLMHIFQGMVALEMDHKEILGAIISKLAQFPVISPSDAVIMTTLFTRLPRLHGETLSAVDAFLRRIRLMYYPISAVQKIFANVGELQYGGVELRRAKLLEQIVERERGIMAFSKRVDLGKVIQKERRYLAALKHREETDRGVL